MTRNEILTHIHNHPKMHHLLASIYQHEDYTWAKESGLNASACLFIDNNEHNGDLVVTTGAGDRSPESDFLKTHNKYYHPNELTPEKIDQIIAEDIPELYKLTMKDVTDYLESNKIKSLNKDFE